MIVQANPGQTIFDISLQQIGNMDNLFPLLRDNNLPGMDLIINSDNLEGRQINIDDTVQKTNLVVNYYTYPVTSY